MITFSGKVILYTDTSEKAIIRVLETTLQEASTEKKRKLIIKTDSKYSINCTQKFPYSHDIAAKLS